MSRRDCLTGIVGRIIYMMLGAALMLLALIWAGPLQAATFSGDQDSCENLSMVAGRVAATRDDGMPWEELEARMNFSLAMAQENPDSYVKTVEDAAWILGVFKRIYETKVTPEEAYSHMMVACMRNDKSIAI